MSKPCRRPSRTAIKEQRAQKKQQELALNERRRRAGLLPHRPAPRPNRGTINATTDEEQQTREAAVSGQFRLLRRELPALLARLEQIPNPRDPKKCRHRLTVLLIDGLLMFVFQFASRREVNRELTRPQFEANLRLLFPELETLPHADTLYRLLRDSDVAHLEQAHIELVQRLIRAKTFRRYLIQPRLSIAIDGSQKLAGDTLWDENLLQRTVGAEDNRHPQYFVYVLEASLAFQNGLVIPQLSEFLEYAKGDTDAHKQDCEQRAFARLSERLKALFPRLPILLLLDGLYANGPVMQRCRHYHWQFMSVLKNQDLATVWEEFHALHALQPNGFRRNWGQRRQRFSWVNGIDYAFSQHGRRHLSLHVVVCEETWETVDDQGHRVTKSARHAWLSSHPLSRDNVHERCNLGARYRWGIEANFLVEKHQGYHYEHAFALNWSAMKGYHYLMHLAHLFNALARFARHLRDLYRELGVRSAIAFIRATCAAPWLDPARMRGLLAQPLQLQLEYPHATPPPTDHAPLAAPANACPSNAQYRAIAPHRLPRALTTTQPHRFATPQWPR